MSSYRFGAFILSAGYSSRMGDFKPLMQLEGRSLLQWVVSAFRDAGVDTVTVITGHRAGEIRAEAERLGISCLHNADHDQGMFSSVRVAAGAARDLDAFFILPVDIPLVRACTVKTVATAYAGRIVYPVYKGERGHPPLIPSSLVPEILTHDGQGGLKTVLGRQPGQDVPVWDRGILLDADTGDDFAILQTRAARLHIGEPDEIRELAALAMPERGVAHGRAVAEAAMTLGQALAEHGQPQDLELLHNAALLHDIAKGQPQHERRGGEMLADLGLTGLADSVASHRIVPPPQDVVLGAKELVCLADKVCRGPLRVPVEARFQEKLHQYRDDPEACAAIRGRLEKAVGLQRMVENIVGQPLLTILDGEPA